MRRALPFSWLMVFLVLVAPFAVASDQAEKCKDKLVSELEISTDSPATFEHDGHRYTVSVDDWTVIQSENAYRDKDSVKAKILISAQKLAPKKRPIRTALAAAGRAVIRPLVIVPVVVAAALGGGGYGYYKWDQAMEQQKREDFAKLSAEEQELELKINDMLELAAKMSSESLAEETKLRFLRTHASKLSAKQANYVITSVSYQYDNRDKYIIIVAEENVDRYNVDDFLSVTESASKRVTKLQLVKYVEKNVKRLSQKEIVRIADRADEQYDHSVHDKILRLKRDADAEADYAAREKKNEPFNFDGNDPF